MVHLRVSGGYNLARIEAEYRYMVAEALAKLGLQVLEMEDIEPPDRRRGRSPDGDVPAEILEIAGQLSESCPVLHDTFYM